MSRTTNERYPLTCNDVTQAQPDKLVWGIFHRLWSRDVGTEGYDKKLWQVVEKRILETMDKDPKP